MKEKTMNVKVYVANDGKQFLDKEECEKHENTINNIRYFVVKHTPDLTETGSFRCISVVAVYSENGYHRNIVERWCVDEMKYAILGYSVQGYGFQPHFEIIDSKSDDDFAKCCWNNFEYNKALDCSNIRYKSKAFLSPKRVEGFPNNFDYMAKWFKN